MLFIFIRSQQTVEELQHAKWEHDKHLADLQAKLDAKATADTCPEAGEPELEATKAVEDITEKQQEEVAEEGECDGEGEQTAEDAVPQPEPSPAPPPVAMTTPGFDCGEGKLSVGLKKN